MHPIIQKTFGGLTKQYYFRQLFFGSLFGAGFIYMNYGTKTSILGVASLSLVCTLLYPYSRFVYESIVGFLMGKNLFIVNAFFLLLFKFFTMALCWIFAILIAPIGLAYLYFYNSRTV